MSRFDSIVRLRSAISRSLPQFAPARRHHARRRLMLERLEDRALLSTFTVNSLGDTGTGSGRSGDLRYVITQVDQTPGDNTIKFAVTGTITLNSALPDLSNTTGLTDIEGPGAASLTVARSSASGTLDFRIFTVDKDETVKIFGLTIAGGTLVNIPSENGAGIDNSGMLTVSNSVFSSNYAIGYGGGLANESVGTLTVRGSTFTSNSSIFGGGGLFNGGTATVSDSTFTSNFARFGGGGLYNDETLTVRHSTFTGNNDRFVGGGLFNDSGGTATVSDSTFTGNSADFDGGGLYNVGTLTVRHSTFTGNSATMRDGGGIFNESGGTATVKGSTFTSNSAEFGGGIFNNNTIDVTVKDSTFKSNVDSVVGGGAIYGPWVGSGNFFSTTNT